MTVHPRDRSVSIAASPVADGAEQPDWSNSRVPAAIPDATSDTRMLSMLVCVRAVFANALPKFPPFTLSKALAGKLVRLVQLYHALVKSVPEDVSIRGKLVRLLQSNHAWEKLVPEDVSIGGKLVRPVQFLQTSLKLVPEDVSIRGKLVRLEQPYHAALKLVPADVSMSGKEVSSDQSSQKLPKLVTAP